MNFVWLSADYCLKNTAYFDKKRANKRQTFCDISIENRKSFAKTFIFIYTIFRTIKLRH